MFRLAHISDVHLRPLPQPSLAQLASKRITGYLNWKLNRKHNLSGDYLDKIVADLKMNGADHTVVTGDLINLALPEEFDQAREFLETLGTPRDVTALCGNHDAYVPGALKTAIKKWQPYMASDDAPLQSSKDFPTLRIRGNVAIIACNSARATSPFMAIGYFRKAQATRLSRLLKQTSGMFRVVCIHHPPIKGATARYKRLIGQDLFREVVANEGAELVLHGHTHLATINQIKGPHGDVPVICVPAAGNGHGDHRPAGRYNLFTIDKQADHWLLEMRAFACNVDGNSMDLVEERRFKAWIK